MKEVVWIKAFPFGNGSCLAVEVYGKGNTDVEVVHVFPQDGLTVEFACGYSIEIAASMRLRWLEKRVKELELGQGGWFARWRRNRRSRLAHLDTG